MTIVDLFINNWDYLYDVNNLYIIEYCSYTPELFIYKSTSQLYINNWVKWQLYTYNSVGLNHFHLFVYNLKCEQHFHLYVYNWNFVCVTIQLFANNEQGTACYMQIIYK